MRLISQKSIGYIDVEYEKGIVFLRNEEKRTMVVYIVNDRLQIVIAAYDSEYKARKVLKDMREIYEDYIIAEGYQKVFYFAPPKIFEFPENNAVEV
nr:MAG TPA: hypothetical protein [Caudoviricetes sp.]